MSERRFTGWEFGLWLSGAGLIGGVAGFGIGVEYGRAIPVLEFSGEASRGAFVPGPPEIKYRPADGSDWTCLVGVTNDDPAVWHYKVWRDGIPGELTGKGPVMIPQ